MSNFSIFPNEWSFFEILGKQAEENIYRDPNITLIKVRQFAEKMTEVIFKMENMPYDNYNGSQVDRLRELEQNGLLDEEIASKFHDIRKMGNQAAHDGYGNKSDAMKMVRYAHYLSNWFMYVYGPLEFVQTEFFEPKNLENEQSSIIKQLQAKVELAESEKILFHEQLEKAIKQTKEETKVEIGKKLREKFSGLEAVIENTNPITEVQPIKNSVWAITSEKNLEEKLVEELSNNGYERVLIRNEIELYENLRIQLEKFNKCTISKENFELILRHLNMGHVYEKAKKLRDGFPIEIDGKRKTIWFLEQKDWCKNLVQVTNQIKVNGSHKNRYDVTILFNGLPLVQIELKRPGLDVKQAFNQCIRYKSESMKEKLFDYIQIFVISNGNKTSYFANQNSIKSDDFGQVVRYADAENQKIDRLSDFAFTFLEKCQLSKLITQYMLLVDNSVSEYDGTIILMRPYQVHAAERIMNKVKDTVGNGYVWHTTGSGKTLTSFKTAHLVSQEESVDKVIFIVDRIDLDAQTNDEYLKFGGNLQIDIERKESTREVIRHLKSKDKLMVTTIQKIDNALKEIGESDLQNKRVVLMFDECHRSQKGMMHRRIDQYFHKLQKIGFTGTPIFVENSVDRGGDFATTSDIFDECLHRYILPNAIDDEKVLGFSVQYINAIATNNKDVKMKEVYDSPDYQTVIASKVLDIFDRNTHNRMFNAMFAAEGIKNAVSYYRIFNELQVNSNNKLKIASIFSFQENEEQNGQTTKEALAEIMKQYNKDFKTNYTIDNFNGYRADLMQRVKNKEIDLVVVSDMLLTGFDAKRLNTLYVDKNLRYHGLIQAFSRTNRIYSTMKDYGNIICFRDLKENVDEAITLFSNRAHAGSVLKKTYHEYLENVIVAWDNLTTMFPEPKDIANLEDDNERKAFIEAFKDLNRHYKQAQSFYDFDIADIIKNSGGSFSEALYVEYKDEYVDQSRITKLEPDSILGDIDFELELIHSDKINYAYIMELLRNLKNNMDIPKEEYIEKINKLEIDKGKRDLLLEFVDSYYTSGIDGDVVDEFEAFNQAYKFKVVNQIIEEYGLDAELFIPFINDFEWHNIIDAKEKIIESFNRRLTLLERRRIPQKIYEKIVEIFETIDF